MPAPSTTRVDVTAAILVLTRELGRTPTFRELARWLGLSGRRHAWDWCARLQADGILRADRHVALAPRTLEGLARIVATDDDPRTVAAALVKEKSHGPR